MFISKFLYLFFVKIHFFCLFFFLANDSGSNNLLVFPELLDCISILDCILTEPAGGALLAGRAGVGRKTALQIVAHMNNLTVFSPKLGDNYSTDNFKNDLKSVSIPFFF